MNRLEIESLNTEELESLIRRIIREELARNKNQSEFEYLTVNEASQYLKTSTRTIRSYIDKGNFKVIRKEGIVRILRGELDRFMMAEGTYTD